MVQTVNMFKENKKADKHDIYPTTATFIFQMAQGCRLF